MNKVTGWFLAERTSHIYEQIDLVFLGRDDARRDVEFNCLAVNGFNDNLARYQYRKEVGVAWQYVERPDGIRSTDHSGLALEIDLEGCPGDYF